MSEKISYTIDDIAKELGISKTTVSRAISGKGRLSIGSHFFWNVRKGLGKLHQNIIMMYFFL